MNRLISWLNIIIKKHKRLKRWQRIVTILAAVITFVTTYVLILPAITVEKDETDLVSGMYLEEVTEIVGEGEEEAPPENALVPMSFVIAADQENAVTYSYEDDDIFAELVISTDEELPEGTELVVNYVDPESEDYAGLSSRARDLLSREFINEISTCSFFDFALVCDNIDVTPGTGYADIRIFFHNNTVEHTDDALYVGKFALPIIDEGGLLTMSAGETATREEVSVDYDEETSTEESPTEEYIAPDELVSENGDETSVLELSDGIITSLILKGCDLTMNDSVVGILAGFVDEETKAAAEESEMILEASEDVEGTEDLSDAEKPEKGEEDDMTSAASVGTLTASGKDYTVKLTYDEISGVPADAELKVSEIDQNSKEYETYLEETKKAMGLTEEETLPQYAARFFDIKIMVDGAEFTPESGVTVEIAYAENLAEKENMEVNALHFTDGAASPEVIDANVTEISEDGTSNVEFTAESFSVYGVVYTVDFHFEVNGREFAFSIQGGETVSLKNVLSALNIVPGENQAMNRAEQEEEDAKVGDEEMTAYFYEDAEDFIANIESVTFTDEELLQVVQITENTTAAALKDALGLVAEPSTRLTEEELAEFDARELIAPDWALISLKAFDSEEELTVTMKDGEVFTILVTDLNENPFGLDGNSFKIVNNAAMTATYGANNNTYHQTLSSNGNAANGETWTFEYTGTGTGYLIKDSRGRYLLMDRTTGLTFTDRDTALEHPIVVENTVDQNGRRGYIFYDLAKEYCLTYGSLNNRNVFYLNTANAQNAACCMELRNPGDTSNPGLISTADTRAEGIKINLFDYGTDTLDEEANAWTHRTSGLGTNEWTYVRDGNNRVIGAIRNTYNTGINANHRLKFMSHGTSNYENIAHGRALITSTIILLSIRIRIIMRPERWGRVMEPETDKAPKYIGRCRVLSARV